MQPAGTGEPAYTNSTQNTQWLEWPASSGADAYRIRAQGSYSFPNDSLYVPDGPNSCSMGTMLGRRAYTTIDRSKPTAAMTLAGGAAYAKDPKIALKIDFAATWRGRSRPTSSASSTAAARMARCGRA